MVGTAANLPPRAFRHARIASTVLSTTMMKIPND